MHFRKNMSTTLQVDRIAKSFPTRSGELVVLREASLSVGESESLAIMGPSGSGKSTLLNILGTLEPPTSGRVTLDGTDPFSLSDRELAKFRNHKIGFVFQEHHLLPQLSVIENVLMPTLADRGNVNRIERARTLLDRVGLSQRLEHRPAELSGGERQRAAMARALINQPALILADEPTGNLDRTTAETVADLLMEIHRDENVALIVVTHSEALAGRCAQRRELLDGRLVPL